jgi:TolB-like protein/Tfp pilus assembly protein PilF
MRMAAEPGERDTNGVGAASAQPDLSPESIRVALDKILASSGFVNADRLTRFLRYTVEETLNGQTDKLKETLLGIEVFNRKPTYDPRVDAVVRTEAVKLRARLRDYYEADGRDDELIIDLPKGGYVPAFRLREKVPDPPPVAAVETLDSPHPGYDWRPAAAGALILVILAVSIFITTRSRKRPPAGSGGTEVASIAVLPFADLSPERDQEYFCDGMTEEIIDALAKVEGFRVVARTSSFAFKGKQQDIREIGKKLNVGAVLEGSVRKDGNLLRVTAQLNSVTDGYHLWSQTYERELKDVFSVQDEIAKAIVNTLQLKLSTVKPKSAENVEAYDLYLQGRYHWDAWRLESAQRALQFFELATRKDPKFAAAYAGISDSYCWLAFFGNSPANEVMPKARAAAEKAIALDDSLAEAHTSLGYVKALYDYDWPGAEREFQRAIQLNPGLTDAHFGYGIVYMAPQGRGEESLREMLIAHDLDPLSPVMNTYLGLAYQFVRQVDEGIAYDKKALDLDPNFVEARLDLAMRSLDKKPGREAEFEANLAAAKGLAPESRIDLQRAFGYAIFGRKADALALVHKWDQPKSGVFERPSSIAQVFAILGDREQMYVWLDRAYAQRDGMLAFVNHQGCFQPYRKEDRFIALDKKIGLPTSE